MHPFKSVAKPILDFGAPHPGFMSMSGGMPKWEGDLCWDMRHGTARSLWVAGRLAGVYNAMAPDGSRAAELKPGMPESDRWRRTDLSGRLVRGTLHLSQEDILFADDRDQTAPGQWASGSLPASLLASHRACAAVADEGFAVDLYGSLCSSVWSMKSSGKEYHGTWTRAAEVVAQMRDRGEICTDFYLNGNEGYVTDEAADLLGDLGWHLMGVMETPAQMMKRASKLVEVCEGRQPGMMPDWYVHWISGLRKEDTLDARMHRAAFAGQAPYKDWVKFWEWFDFEAA